MWKVVRQIIIHRKKKELEPVIKILDNVSDVEGSSEEKEAFLEVIKDIQLFATKADKTLDKMIESDANWLMKTFMKMI
jgi:heme oxygenase